MRIKQASDANEYNRLFKARLLNEINKNIPAAIVDAADADSDQLGLRPKGMQVPQQTTGHETHA
jgi:hypothetical protein